MNQNKKANDKKYSNGKAKTPNKKVNAAFDLRNADKKNKNFMYQNIAGGKCHRCNFSESNFDYANFRGASMKDCKFRAASFKGTEFIGANLKDSDFSNATFENCIFEGAKVVDANFSGATFINCIFLMTDLSLAKNIDLDNEGIRVYEEMPELELNEALRTAYEKAMVNPIIKKSRVLDTKEGKLNYVSVIRLLEHFDEEILTKGLNGIETHLERDFYTLSFIITLIKKLEKNEEL